MRRDGESPSVPEAISVGTGGPALSGLVAVSCLPACLVPAGCFWSFEILVVSVLGSLLGGFLGLLVLFVSAA